MAGQVKHRRGDRPDAVWVREGHGLQSIMAHLMPNRADNEVYLNFKIDATELMKYLDQKNSGDPEVKTTIFHCAVTGIARMITERPEMNRYIQGRRLYQRDEISLSFVAKRRFADGADEALMILKPKETDTVNEIARKIVGDVHEMRKSEHADAGSIDEKMDIVAKWPRPIIALVVKALRIADFWGFAPRFITDDDPNYTTVLMSNLGSIKCPAVYHHLNNYGTNSIMVTIGALHKEELLMEDGHKEIRDVIDFGATLDERIGDGFYFARSLKLITHIFAHPELLEQPLNVHSGFVYE